MEEKGGARRGSPLERNRIVGEMIGCDEAVETDR